MDEGLAQRFEQNRTRLRAVAYRMLGSLSGADDAVQESWLRLNQTDTSDVKNLGGWLTTVVARVCLDMIRSRQSRHEEPFREYVPEPIVSPEDATDPEEEAILADSVGLAMLVVLNALAPAERLGFVSHDMFGVPFDEIAPIVGRSTIAARQLASRARRRVRDAAPVPDTDLNRQWEAVDAFLAASRDGEFDALLTVLDPDVLLRVDTGAVPAGASGLVRGAHAVAQRAQSFAWRAQFARRALANGAAGLVVVPHDRPCAIIGFTVRDGRIVQIDILADPARLRQFDLATLRA